MAEARQWGDLPPPFALALTQAANYRAAPLCNGDPDDLILKLADMPGEKVAKVKVGLYEAVRDGMVVNLL
ncbi:hypothetical protein ACUODJ_62265, partial [Escherichia sp. HC-CC]